MTNLYTFFFRIISLQINVNMVSVLGFFFFVCILILELSYVLFLWIPLLYSATYILKRKMQMTNTPLITKLRMINNILQGFN